MDLDLALRVSSPASLTVESSSDEKRDIERWEKSNRMCLMIIKKAIPEAFRGTISETIKTTKEFVTPHSRGSVDYPSTCGNTRECRVTRHFSQKSGRVSFVRGALPKYKTCIYLSQQCNKSNISNHMSNTATWAHKRYS